MSIKETIEDKKARLEERRNQLEELRNSQQTLSHHGIQKPQSEALIRQVEEECNILKRDIKEQENK